MSSWQRAVLDALAVAGRLREFQRDHPGTQLSHPDDKAQVWVPYGTGGITVTRDTAAEALAAAEEKLREAP